MNYEKNYYDYLNYVKSLNRFKGDGNYYEWHHILPKSLGGLNTEDNLVLLTAREHFLAHYLLCKFLKGSELKSMIWAFHRMQYSEYDNQYRYTNSRLYEAARKNFKNIIFDDTFKKQVSERAKNTVWINDGKNSKMIKKDNLDNFLSQNPQYKIGRLSFKHKKSRKKETQKRKIVEKRYWMYKEDENKDIMVPLKEISSLEKEGWKRGRLKMKKTQHTWNNGRVRIIKDDLEKLVPLEDLDKYLSDGWTQGRRQFSEEAKEKMSKSRKDPNGKLQKYFEKLRNGEINRPSHKCITLFKDGQYLTLNTNTIDITPYLEDGWIKQGRPKSDEWKLKMKKSWEKRRNNNH